jgi:hypothetical protein
MKAIYSSIVAPCMAAKHNGEHSPMTIGGKETRAIKIGRLNKCCWTNIVSTSLLLGIRSLNALLAHSIAVNTSHRSYGYYKPGHTSPHCIRLDSVIQRK